MLFLFAIAALQTSNLPSSPLNEIDKKDDASTCAFFSNRTVYLMKLEVSPENLINLHTAPRDYIQATVREGGLIYTNVGLHLKGGAGSFREINDPRPAFTLNFSEFDSSLRFHGARKIHLNNAAQDPSYLNENLAGELFRAAGLPAARVAYAMVELNQRKLGLYVLKEGMTKDFLRLYFGNSHGNLYDAKRGQDITERMNAHSGRLAPDWLDLKALLSATEDKDPSRRWTRLAEFLDVDRFLSFMGMEMITCHWDGYCISQNNFRIYHNPDTDKLVFLPHGMDQVFGDPNYPIKPYFFKGVVAQAIIQTPQGRKQYRDRINLLVTNVFRIQSLTNWIIDLFEQIHPVLREFNTNAAREFEAQAMGLQNRLIQRASSLHRFRPDFTVLLFERDTAKLSEWTISPDEPNAILEKVKSPGGRETLRICATAETKASWRLKVLLRGGHYLFEGEARTASVQPTNNPKKGEGAGLRVAGKLQPRQNHLCGDSPWQHLFYEFDVAYPDDEVELLCELRATKGEVLFDLESLRLVKAK